MLGFYEELDEHGQKSFNEGKEAMREEVLNIFAKYIKEPPYNKFDAIQPLLKEINEKIKKL